MFIYNFVQNYYSFVLFMMTCFIKLLYLNKIKNITKGSSGMGTI